MIGLVVLSCYSLILFGILFVVRFFYNRSKLVGIFLAANVLVFYFNPIYKQIADDWFESTLYGSDSIIVECNNIDISSSNFDQEVQSYMWLLSIRTNFEPGSKIGRVCLEKVIDAAYFVEKGLIFSSEGVKFSYQSGPETLQGKMVTHQIRLDVIKFIGDRL